MAIRTTLLDLVEAVSEFSDNEAEVVATVVHMVNSGVVELCGTFRGQRFAEDVAFAAWVRSSLDPDRRAPRRRWRAADRGWYGSPP